MRRWKDNFMNDDVMRFSMSMRWHSFIVIGLSTCSTKAYFDIRMPSHQHRKSPPPPKKKPTKQQRHRKTHCGDNIIIHEQLVSKQWWHHGLYNMKKQNKKTPACVSLVLLLVIQFQSRIVVSMLSLDFFLGPISLCFEWSVATWNTDF